MFGNDDPQLERSGGGCSFGCTCPACRQDLLEEESKPRYSRYKSDEQYGYTYKPNGRR